MFTSCATEAKDDFSKAIAESKVELWRSQTMLSRCADNSIDCFIYELSFQPSSKTVVIATFKWNSGYDPDRIKTFQAVSETHEYCYYNYDSDGKMYLFPSFIKVKDYEGRMHNYNGKGKWIPMIDRLDFSECNRKELVFNGIADYY